MRLAIFAVVVSATVGSAQETTTGIPPEKREEIVAAVKKGLAGRGVSPAQIATVKEKLDVARTGKINPKAPGIVSSNGGKRIEYPSKDAKEKHIAGLEKQLKKLETVSSSPVADPFAYAPLLSSFKVGDFGRILDTQNIRQVVGPKSALVNCRLLHLGTVTKGKVDVPLAVIYFDGLDTSAMADGMGATVPGIWYLAGNRQFDGRTYLRAVRFQPTAAELAAVTPAKP